MAIGRPISLTDNVASKRISVGATAGQTAFTVPGGYRINAINVFRNGVRLSGSVDFTATDGVTVNLVNPASLNDEISFEIFDDFKVSNAIVSAASTQTIDGNLTVTGDLLGASIGIQSGGANIGSAKTLNFIGSGNTFAVNGNTIDVSIAGGGGGGTAPSDAINNAVFIHYGAFEGNDAIKIPNKFGEIYTHVDAAVDIEDGITVDVDSECLLLITDKEDFDINHFAPVFHNTDLPPQSNTLRSAGFDNNIRTTLMSSDELSGRKKVGYVKIPEDLQDEIFCDVEDGTTFSVGDHCVLII